MQSLEKRRFEGSEVRIDFSVLCDPCQKSRLNLLALDSLLFQHL